MIPSQLLEASNGTLMILVLTMFCFAMSYAVRAVTSELRWRSLSHILRDRVNKASLAWSNFLLGVLLSVVARWWFRVAQHHQWWGGDTQSNALSVVVIAGTLLAVWGGVCWIRAMTPKNRPPWLWLAVSVVALVFGVLTATL